jgi:hypothetical protein
MRGRNWGLGQMFLMVALEVGCGGPARETEDVGAARIALTSVPADAQCLALSAVGARTVSKRFSLQAGADATLELAGLPLGAVEFSAAAFDASCDSSIATEPTWIGDPVSANIVKGEIAQIALTLHRNGQASVSVSFCDNDLQSDIANCGACDHACIAGPRSQPTCTAGSCGLACDEGAADCDQNAATGCEVLPDTDPANCGACGHACIAGPRSQPTCAAGACGFACDPGAADCDHDAATGCEVLTDTDAANCGACGNACPAGFSCRAGACTAPPVTCGVCVIGQERCDPLRFGPVFCTAGPDGCGYWPQAMFGACNGVYPWSGTVCDNGYDRTYCTADAAGCRVSMLCPVGQICRAGYHQAGSCGPM